LPRLGDLRTVALGLERVAPPHEFDIAVGTVVDPRELAAGRGGDDLAVRVPREVVDHVVTSEPGAFFAGLPGVVPGAGLAYRAQLADPGDVADDRVHVRRRRGDGDRIGVVVAG